MEMTTPIAHHSDDLTGVTATRPLFETKGRAEKIVETAPDAFIGFDLDSCIVDWNAQASAVFGWSREAAIGRSFWGTILTQPCYEAHCQGKIRFQRIVDAPVGRHRLELSGRHRDGREFPIEITICGPMHSATGDFFGAFARDISERKKHEEELRQTKEAAESYSKTLETLNGISHELSALLNTDELLQRIGELLYQIVAYHTVSVMLVDSSREFLKHRFSLSSSVLNTKPDIPIG